MECKICGAKNSDDANFCRMCGQKLRKICNCYIKKEPYNCGQDQCPGYRLFQLEKQGAVHYTLANLFEWNDKTIASVAEAMDEDFTTVMSWICGKVPESYQTIKLARVLGCKLTEVYKAILDTPNLIDPRATEAEDSKHPLPGT